MKYSSLAIYVVIISFLLYRLDIFSSNDIISLNTIKNKNITLVEIDEKNTYAYFYTNNETYKLSISSLVDLESKLNVTDNINIIYKEYTSYIDTIYVVIQYTLIFSLIFILTRSLILKKPLFDFSLLSGSVTEFIVNKNIKIRFTDVIGLEPVKEQMKEYINYFKHRNEYLKKGCKIPKGLIFSGEAGTGKTLLAKALAGESNISFLSTSGSDFIESFVGAGSKKIKNLFKLARELEPCIIFIDEIDSIGKDRKKTMNRHSEYNSILNTLLSELDGFTENNNILVIAATNLVETLDKALVRSGRFDIEVSFDKPNITERKEMFKLFMKNISLHHTVENNLEQYINILAKQTAGLTGADISSIVNHAIMLYMKRLHNNDFTIMELEDKYGAGATLDDLINSIADISIGLVKRERSMTDKEKNIVAHHEAGHALVAYLLNNCDSPVKVSIIPRGRSALGYSQQEPNDKKLYSKNELLSQICILLGGRTSELIVFNSVTTGASDDIEKLTKIAKSIVIKYGMNVNIGCLDLDYDGISEKTKTVTEHEMKEIVDNCTEITNKILNKNSDYINRIAEYLLEHEEISKKDLINIVGEELNNSIDIEELLS